MIMRLKNGHTQASGFVARDAEMKMVGENNTKKTRFSIKVDEVGEGREKESIWMECVAWRNEAEIAARIKKGDSVMVCGKVREYEYNDRECTEIVCDFIQIQSRIAETGTQGSAKTQATGASRGSFEDAAGDIPDDDDLPF